MPLLQSGSPLNKKFQAEQKQNPHGYLFGMGNDPQFDTNESTEMSDEVRSTVFKKI